MALMYNVFYIHQNVIILMENIKHLYNKNDCISTKKSKLEVLLFQTLLIKQDVS